MQAPRKRTSRRGLSPPAARRRLLRGGPVSFRPMFWEDDQKYRGGSAKLGDVVGIDRIDPHRGCVDCPYSARHGVVVEIGESSLTLRMLFQGDLPSAHIIVPKCAVYTPSHGLFQLELEESESERALSPHTRDQVQMLELEAALESHHRRCLRCPASLCDDDDASFLLLHPLYNSGKAVCGPCLELTPRGRCVVCFVPSKPDENADTSEALLQHAYCTGCGISICMDCMACQLPFCLKYGVLPQIQRSVPKFTCGRCDSPRDLTIPPLTREQQALQDARNKLADSGFGSDSGSESDDSDSDLELTRFVDLDPDEMTLLFKTATCGKVWITRAKLKRLSRTSGLVFGASPRLRDS